MVFLNNSPSAYACQLSNMISFTKPAFSTQKMPLNPNIDAESDEIFASYFGRVQIDLIPQMTTHLASKISIKSIKNRLGRARPLQDATGGFQVAPKRRPRSSKRPPRRPKTASERASRLSLKRSRINAMHSLN